MMTSTRKTWEVVTGKVAEVYQHFSRCWERLFSRQSVAASQTVTLPAARPTVESSLSPSASLEQQLEHFQRKYNDLLTSLTPHATKCESCGQTLQDSNGVSLASKGDCSPNQGVLIVESRWAVIALVLASLALFAVLIIGTLRELQHTADARNAREVAQLLAKAEVAKAEALAQVAKIDAKLAVTDVARLREDLRVAGIKVSED